MKIKPDYSREKEEPLNESRAHLIISELAKASVKHVLIAPGSRSTLLALAASENPMIETTIHFDERGLGFHAVGIAKATLTPPCLICTSGTALANLYPAIIEASLDLLPLIILSADRPPELRDVGANQTIDQVNIFGRYLRWEFDLPCPDKHVSEDVVASVMNQGYFRCKNPPSGPVLINCMFREPFIEEPKKPSLPMALSPLPKTRYFISEKSLPSEEISHIVSDLSSFEKGVIIVGKLHPLESYEEILSLAARLGWPILPDILSGVRSVGRDSAIIPYYNHILKTSLPKNKLLPEVILHFGGSYVSKPILQWLKSLSLKKYYQIANFPHRQDPTHQVTDKVDLCPLAFCKQALRYIKTISSGIWLSLWKEHSLHIEETIKDYLENSDIITEPFTVHSLLHHLHEDVLLYFGTSLPIRHADNFFFPHEKSGHAFSNRGTSGIDGNLAAILGIAKGSKKPVVGVIGDLTLLHDLNSLSLFKNNDLSVTLIVINNYGGGIFNYFPLVKNRMERFEEFMRAKHSLDLEPFIKAFQAEYGSPKTKTEYREMLTHFIEKKGIHVIEIKTDAEYNFAFHEELDTILQKKLLQSKKEKEFCYFLPEKRH